MKNLLFAIILFQIFIIKKNKINMKRRTVLFVLSFGILTSLFSQTPIKKVMLEEFTTTLCGMCPPRSYAINEWQQNHPNSSILLTIHEGFGRDSMSNTLTSEYYNAFKPPSGLGFAPAIMIDRGYYPYMYPNEACPYITTNGFDSIALRVSNNTAAVSVSFQGTYNSSTRNLNITVLTEFFQNVPSADYRITLLLVEDSVVGSGSGWDQKCYDAAFANLHYPGQYNATTQYISNYPHRKVLRSALLGTWGSSGIIPTNPVIGTVYSKSTTYVVPSQYNANRINLVAFVSKYASSKIEKYILNANDIKLTDLIPNNIEEKQSESKLVINEIYPLPASGGDVHLNYTLKEAGNVQVKLVNMLGETIKTLGADKKYPEGTYELVFNTSGLSKGIYFINLKTDKDQIVRKLIIN